MNVPRGLNNQSAILAVLFPLCLLSPNTGLSQGGPPPLPPIPFDALDFWKLEKPGWSDWYDGPARGFTNLNVASSWDYDGTALSVDTNVCAYLEEEVFQDGWTNIVFDSGSISLLFQPNWTSVTDGGAGPTNWAALLSVGNWTSNAAQSAWTLAISPDGTNLVMEAQSAGSNQVVFEVPIDFDAGDWHSLTVTYSSTNCCVYLEGQPATNTGPILYSPSYEDCSNYGMFIGSLLTSGIFQCHGQLQWLATYDYPLSADAVAADYAGVSSYITYFGGSLPATTTGGGGGFHNYSSGPPVPPGGGTNSGGGSPDSFTNAVFTPPATISPTNYAAYDEFYLTITNSPTTAYVAVCNTLSNITYEIWTNSNLSASNGWRIWQVLLATNNVTPAPSLALGSNAMYFKGVLVFSTGTNGLPDYWCMEYFRTLNVNPYADPDGDGLCNLDEYVLGLNPTNAHTLSSLHTDAQALILAYTNDPACIHHLFITNTANTNVLLVTLSPTLVGSNYQIYSQVQSATNGPWIVETNFLGTNTATSVLIYLNGRSLSLIGGYGEDSDGDGLPDGYEVLATHTDPYLPDTGITGIPDGYKDPDGDGYVNLEEYYNGTDPLVFNTPAGPGGVSVVLSSNGTSATITWNPSASATNYTIQRDSGSGFATIATVSSPQTSYQDNSLTAGVNVRYRIIANFPLGSSFPSSSMDTLLRTNYTTSAVIVRGPGGALYLVVSAVSTNISTFRVYHTNVANCYYPIAALYSFYTLWAPYYYDGSLSPAPTFTNGFFDVPVASFSNGVCKLTTNQVPSFTVNQFSVQALGANGKCGEMVEVGQITGDPDRPDYNIPFFDGRTNIAQNINFLLRVGNPDAPFVISYIGFAAYEFPEPYPDYVFAGWHFMNGDQSIYGASELDEFWPFEENNYYLNLCPSFATFDDYGNATSGVDVVASAGGNFECGTVGTLAKYFDTVGLVSGTASPSMAPLLTSSVSQWIYPWGSYILVSEDPYTYEIPAGSNYYGLPLESIQIAEFGHPGALSTIYPGNETTNSGNIFADYGQPTWTSNGYYFARQHIEPLPGETNFTGANQMPSLLLLSVGGQFSVTAWARQSLQNGLSGINAYAEQYFDKAYLAGTNGNATTNQTGILSEYGEFFATQPGHVLLTTKPDATTGTTGQLSLNVIRLSLDVNHDGITDETFTGPDNTSAQNPYVFWANNSYDRWNTTVLDGTVEDDVAANAAAANSLYTGLPVPDYEYRDANGHRIIPCPRDLEDYARMWVSGISSNVLSNLPSGSTVTLSWAGIGNSPTIDLFQAADTNGGIGYLTNLTTASNQINTNLCRYVGRLGPGGSIQLNASTFSNNWAGNYYIWCGVWFGNDQLNLTISNGNGNQLAQSSQYIQIQDIKQMYERWTVGDDPNTPPAAPISNAVPAADNFSPGYPTSSFLYPAGVDTNDDYIVFVHGWNMPSWEKDRYAETAYKRLYWQGYQGRFGSFRWPCNLFNPLNLGNYDIAEWTAWQSGQPLNTFLTSLNSRYPGKVYVLAHSMGNVVTGEALRLAGTNKIVNTYVASQAAVSARAYDNTVPADLTNSFTFVNTPDSEGHYYTNGAPSYFSSIAGAAKFIDYYNNVDWALGKWAIDQDTKPDIYYNYTTPSSQYPSGYYRKPPFGTSVPLLFGTNTYEIFARAVQSYSLALGAETNVARQFPSSLAVNLNAAPYNFLSTHPGHSEQFRFDNMTTAVYWKQLLSSFQIEP